MKLCYLVFARPYVDPAPPWELRYITGSDREREEVEHDLRQQEDPPLEVKVVQAVEV